MTDQRRRGSSWTHLVALIIASAVAAACTSGNAGNTGSAPCTTDAAACEVGPDPAPCELAMPLSGALVGTARAKVGGCGQVAEAPFVIADMAVVSFHLDEVVCLGVTGAVSLHSISIIVGDPKDARVWTTPKGACVITVDSTAAKRTREASGRCSRGTAAAASRHDLTAETRLCTSATSRSPSTSGDEEEREGLAQHPLSFRGCRPGRFSASSTRSVPSTASSMSRRGPLERPPPGVDSGVAMVSFPRDAEGEVCDGRRRLRPRRVGDPRHGLGRRGARRPPARGPRRGRDPVHAAPSRRTAVAPRRGGGAGRPGAGLGDACCGVGLDALVAALPRPPSAIALRASPPLPATVAERITNYRAMCVADWVMYRSCLADAARARGIDVSTYDPATVLDEAAAALGAASLDPWFAKARAQVGAPWQKDHRLAMAAAIVAARAASAR